MDKTSNGRFIEKRVKINPSLLNEIIKVIKKEGHYTWKDLSLKLRQGEHTIRVGWFKENRTFHLSVFKKLISLDKNISFQKIKDKIKILDSFLGKKQEIKI